MKDEPDKTCPHCGAKMMEYKHSLNAPIVRALAKLMVIGHPASLLDLDIDRITWTNFQKLRYWDLVYRVEEEDGTRRRGMWGVTDRGKKFMFNLITVPRSVWSYRGRRVRYDGELVSCLEFMPQGWKDRITYAMEAQPHGENHA